MIVQAGLAGSSRRTPHAIAHCFRWGAASRQLLGKMAASGIVKWVDGIGRTKEPTLLAREVTVQINLFESKDIVAFA